MSEIVVPLIGVLLVSIASLCCLVGAPLVIYYTLRMGRCKRRVPPSWHDCWGLNVSNLIFFPRLLDERGRHFRERAVRGWLLLAIGAACAVGAAMLGVFGPLPAP